MIWKDAAQLRGVGRGVAQERAEQRPPGRIRPAAMERHGGEHKAGQREGLREATSNLEDYFYLDTLSTNQSAKITLKVALDGETQGNDYQDTLANLMMKFAVELTDAKGSRTNPVKTGDDTDLNPYYIAMLLSGLILLYFVLDVITDRIYGKRARR